MSDLKEVFVDENLVHGKQVKVGLISDNFRAQSTQDGKPIKVCIYDERFIDYLSLRLRQHVDNRYDNKCLFTGMSGTGKDTIAQTLGQKLFPDMPQENVCFRLSDFTDRLYKMKPARPEDNYYPAAVLSESGVDLFSHDWQKRSVKEFNMIFQIIRKNRLTTLFCLPHRDLLEAGIRNQMHWWFDTKAMHEYRGFCIAREVTPNEWGNPWWRPLAAFTFNELDTPFWNEYETRKDRFIFDFMEEKKKNEQPIKMSARATKLMEQRDSAIRGLRKAGVSLRDIEKMTGLDDAGVSRISNKPAP